MSIIANPDRLKHSPRYYGPPTRLIMQVQPPITAEKVYSRKLRLTCLLILTCAKLRPLGEGSGHGRIWVVGSDLPYVDRRE